MHTQKKYLNDLLTAEASNVWGKLTEEEKKAFAVKAHGTGSAMQNIIADVDSISSLSTVTGKTRIFFINHYSQNQ